MTYVTQLREDGKLDLSLRQTGKAQNENDQLVLLEALKKNQGFLPYHDKTDPEIIRDRFSMSKKAFKRAVGTLYKAKKIIIEPEGIRLI
jgi:predicted RNA-binding protein (virulence factor B family)